jgi:short-subunit dehydrogenase
MVDVPKGSLGLAVVTGGSSGIGFEIARELGRRGYELLIVAEDPDIDTAATVMRADGSRVDVLRADLSKPDGVEAVRVRVLPRGEKLRVLVLNAGVGVWGPFLTTSLEAETEMIWLNCTSVVHLAKHLLPKMVEAGEGKVLITSSIAAEMPGPFYAVYAATKAFLLSFSHAIRNELKGTGVTVTALQPGATDTAFFERARMEDTAAAASDSKADPADVARAGVEAMLAGKDHIVPGWKNKLMMAAAQVTPEPLKAARHRLLTEPGSADRDD